MSSFNTVIEDFSLKSVQKSVICCSCQIIVGEKIREQEWQSVISHVSQYFRTLKYPVTNYNIQNELKKNNNVFFKIKDFSNSFSKSLASNFDSKKCFCLAIDWIFHVNEYSAKIMSIKDKGNKVKAIRKLLSDSALLVRSCLVNELQPNITGKTMQATVDFAVSHFQPTSSSSTNGFAKK